MYQQQKLFLTIYVCIRARHYIGHYSLESHKVTVLGHMMTRRNNLHVSPKEIFVNTGKVQKILSSVSS